MVYTCKRSNPLVGPTKNKTFVQEILIKCKKIDGIHDFPQ